MSWNGGDGWFAACADENDSVRLIDLARSSFHVDEAAVAKDLKKLERAIARLYRTMLSRPY